MVWNTEGYIFYHLHRITILRETDMDLEEVDHDVHNYRVERTDLL